MCTNPGQKEFNCWGVQNAGESGKSCCERSSFLCVGWRWLLFLFLSHWRWRWRWRWLLFLFLSHGCALTRESLSLITPTNRWTCSTRRTQFFRGAKETANPCPLHQACRLFSCANDRSETGTKRHKIATNRRATYWVCGSFLLCLLRCR